MTSKMTRQISKHLKRDVRYVLEFIPAESEAAADLCAATSDADVLRALTKTAGLPIPVAVAKRIAAALASPGSIH